MTQPSDVAAATTELWEIPPKLIEPNPRQPRTVFDEAALAELAASIKEHGLIQPLVVTPNGQPDRYVLIAGERRWRAAQLAGLDVVPCIVKIQIDARAQTELALVENVQRANLSAADEARAYEQLATEFGLSDEAIGARVGKSRSTIANLRRLLALPPSVLAAIGDGDGQIPQGLARQLVPLAKIAPTAVEHAAERIIEHPDEIERIVNQTINDNAITIKYDWDTH
jgi:ParB family transcriptional regulator, chromosome partitioning protein